MKKQKNIRNLTLSAVLLALAYVLPFVTGQIQQIGAMLAPMHIPILLCGFICGSPWGMVAGFLAPLLRSVTVGMPPIFPKGIAMACELATYGFMSGLLYRILPKKRGYIYLALLISMISGRLVWGAVRFICTGMDSSAFGITAFWAGAVTNAIPGIILQIIVVPLLVALINKSNITDK